MSDGLASPDTSGPHAPPPIVPAHVRLPEITPRSLLLAGLLAAVLAGANAYLGLFAGMTVSASIPAAVLSMSILRWFKRPNILENNIVQTAASSGEALAAGVIFTIPALVILGAWDRVDYWQTVGVSLVGGTLGVLFTVPLRRALVMDARLRFPEGLATAEVLKAGMGEGNRAADLRSLVSGALVGGAMKFGESGLRLWTDAVEGAVQVGRTVVYGGLNLSPALVAVGFIIGLPTATVVFGGGVIGWLVLLPLDGWWEGPATDVNPTVTARRLWSTHIRYVGIGAMLVGGLWTLRQVRGAVWSSLLRLHRPEGPAPPAIARAGVDTERPDLRTELDTPGWILLVVFIACILGIMLIYRTIVPQAWIAGLMALAMVIAAFLFSSVAGYMAGLVGSSSNPVSGVTIATIMLTAGLLLLAMGPGHPAGPAATLLIAAVVCCAAAMGGDNLQDLKTGQLVGATPWKQQIMQLVGVGAGALVLPPVLSLLQAKYGIGPPTDLHPQPLSAPQATLMAHLSRGMFAGDLPWHLVTLGALLAVGIIALDQRLSAAGRSFRIPVLAVALGIYLPFKLTAAVMLGGLLQHLVRRNERKGPVMDGPGLLAAAGLITGEALIGILIAVPLALTAAWPSLGADPFRLVDVPPLGPWPGVALLALLGWWLQRMRFRR